MPDLIYNVKFNIQDNLQSSAADVDRYENEIKELQQELRQVNAQLEAVGTNSAKMGAAAKTTGSQVKSMNSSFSATNQLLFATSDGLQDSAQFAYGFSTGMRAVGNNIGFAAELYGSVNQRISEFNEVNAEAIASGQKQAKTIGTELMGSLAGPGGLLLGINLTITAMTVFSQVMQQNEKKAKEAAEGISRYSGQLRELRSLSQFEGGIVSQLEAESRAYTEGIVLLQKQEDILKRVGDLKADDYADPIFVEALEQEAKNISFLVGLYGVKAETVEEAVKQQEELNFALDYFNGSSRDSSVLLGSFIDNLQDATEMQIGAFELGLNDSTEAIETQRETLETIISTYTIAANAGRDDLIPVLIELNRIYDEITQSIDDKTRAQLEELKTQEDLRAAIQRVNEATDQYFEEQAEEERKRDEEERKRQQKRLEDQRKFQAESRKALANPPSFDDGTIDSAEEKIVRRNLELMQMQKDFRVQMVQDFAQAGFDLARSAFGERKEIAIAEALISTYFAAQKAYESQFLPVPDPSSPARGAAAAAAAVVAGLARVAQIKSTDIGGGGGGGSSSSSGASFGFQSTAVSGQPTFQTPSFSPTSQDGMLTPNIKVDIKADRKQLYAIVKKGEEEYRSIKA